ncbi:hypothetical protein [Pseudomonas syringae]|uniref:cGAS/DncV-like nucleotidyltransferase C-terminal helical domain-containing protein n=1 Tax=Pseudomonas syringae pv. pisi TaxID=59510 RepID=A0A3M3U9M0_PSESJ|nr:hypothetical protein [Pseudomonas syringae]PYD29638.1 hypothetical protein DND67_15710 [Pseudomonas syringae pv. pisi]RMO29802.1 hypothetical protein ALQ44_00335 [Pseudomonas syringae pv. pisi]RMV54383.1 hypothetical protein ALP08_00674 [Pseudomonas syringae pv. pisi]
MNTSINERINRLRSRRSGLDRSSVIAMDAKDFIVNRSLTKEAWEHRVKDKPNTTFALGAMQEVDPTYTRISIETAERVSNQLSKRTSGNLEFELQGSVPLNVHIRGVSDVDLLAIEADFHTYDTRGNMSTSGQYRSPTSRTSVGVLTARRGEISKALRDAFPAATIDTSGSKAIKLQGGSLARPVDVVPSHWHDTITYQASGQKHDRAVTILDSHKSTTIENWPFLHIKKVRERCETTGGGLRKSIRLCKNIKAELEAEGKPVTISSFDIASIMYYANMHSLSAGAYYELAILAETQRYLDYLWNNKEEARRFVVPDGSRFIFNSEDKFNGLLHLSVAMDSLLREVAKEQNYLLSLSEKPMLDASRVAVTNSIIF